MNTAQSRSYEWGNGEESSFGNVLLEKNLFGWEIVQGGSLYLLEDSKLNWGHLDLSHNLSGYTELLSGKLTDPEIKSVQVNMVNGEKHQATVINYNDKRFWFLITGGEEPFGTTVTGLSSDGRIIEEIQTSY